MLGFFAFRSQVNNAPLVSIDFIVYNNESEVLSGKQLNAPAKNFFYIR